MLGLRAAEVNCSVRRDPLLCRRRRRSRHCGRRGRAGRHLRSRYGIDLHSGDLHRGHDRSQATEDFVPIHVLHSTFRFMSHGGYVERELVAAAILEDVKVLGIALPVSFSRHRFRRLQFQVAQH